MASQLHEVLVLLFRNRPMLAPELLRDALGVALPRYTEARIESADLIDLQPTEYRADLVVLLCDDEPVLGIVVEVQLRRDRRKQFTWPVYAASLRARIRCPVCLLVVTRDETVARWAATPIDLGGGNHFVPLVLGPSGVPVIADPATARADPELAVLSAMAHGRDRDSAQALRIALAALGASVGLDAERSTLYFDLIVASLGAAARKALNEMDPAKYEYQSEFAKHYIALGKAEGKAEALAAIVTRQLTRRFGTLPAAVRSRLASASPAELDLWAERLLDASSLEAVFRDR